MIVGTTTPGLTVRGIFTVTKAEAQRLISEQPENVPFESDALADLLMARHYWLREHPEYRPRCFIKRVPSRFNKTSYDFQGEFLLDGTWQWHGVSIKKCFAPESPDSRLNDALRAAEAEFTIAYRHAHPVCEDCGERDSEDVHHVHPAFAELRGYAFRGVDTGSLLAGYNWLREEKFRFPSESVPVQRLQRWHRAGRIKLAALCRACHQEAERAKSRVA
ncbi:MAG: hypothetical protein ACREMZ_12900 [Gemmatimonadales bacterium]